MSETQDKTFFRNYTIVIVILSIALALFFILAQDFGIDDELQAKRAAMLKETRSQIEETAPVGKVAVHGDEEHAEEAHADESASAEVAAGKSGEEIYSGLCVACHGTPGIGAPVVGNPEDWAARIDKGMETLYENAINGYSGPEGFYMPPRGGGSFSDDEVKAAVDYMVEKSKGAMETAAAPAGKSGEEVYNGMCVACHSVAAIAPAVGDKAEWAARIAQGTETLYDHAINGFQGEKGLMPPRGGGNFSDDEVKAAVDYMIENSQ